MSDSGTEKSIIPAYSTHSARELTRKRNDVYRKICKVFKVSEADDIENYVKTTFAANIEAFLAGHIFDPYKPNETWQRRVDDCVEFSKLKFDGQAELQKIAREIMHDFINAFYLRSKIKNIYTQDRSLHPEMPYHREHDEDPIMDIYKNHITCEALIKVKSFGFSDRSTLSIVSFLITNSRHIYENVIPAIDTLEEPDTNVMPGIGVIASDRAAHNAIKRIMEYWKKRRTDINKYYRENLRDKSNNSQEL